MSEEDYEIVLGLEVHIELATATKKMHETPASVGLMSEKEVR